MTISLQELKDQIQAGTREQDFIHNSKSDGTGTAVISKMVYIPKFTIPVGAFEGGLWPPVELNLGGFWIDKYAASQPDATSKTRGATAANVPGLIAAASQANVVPWTEIDHTQAKAAAANRKINGRACHLPTMKEWATICYLIKLLGHDIKGNNNYGRDYRDPVGHQYTGVVDTSISANLPGSAGHPYYGNQISRVLTGSGPSSWFHNGMANGIADIVGNVWEWVDFLINAGVYQHIKKAAINAVGGIAAADLTIVIDNVENVADWPAANGLVLIKAEGVNTNEYVIYGTITNNGNGTATLNNCLRGQKTTAASAHAKSAEVNQITDYCVIPGGYSGKISGVGLNNVTNPVTFDYKELVLGPGGAAPAVNDVLQIENEQLIITGVVGTSITATRGANGSPIAAHAADVALTKLSPQMSNNDPTVADINYGAWQFNKYLSLRTEADLIAMGLPATVSAAGSEEYKDGFWLRLKGQRAAFRGGYWDIGAHARSGFALNLSYPPSYLGSGIGFRCALDL